MNNTETAERPSRLGRPPARKLLVGTFTTDRGTERYVVRDPLTGRDYPFTHRLTAVRVARQLLWDNTAEPPSGRPSDINPFNVPNDAWEAVVARKSDYVLIGAVGV